MKKAVSYLKRAVDQLVASSCALGITAAAQLMPCNLLSASAVALPLDLLSIRTGAIGATAKPKPKKVPSVQK